MVLHLFPFALTISLLAQAVVEAQAQDPIIIGKGQKRLTYRETVPWPSARLHPKSHEITWVRGNPSLDGYFQSNSNDGLILQHITTLETRKLLNASDTLPGPSGHNLNADQTKVLWAANKTDGFRYSFKADYFVQDIPTKEMKPLIPDQQGDVQLAVWSPKDPNVIAFVWRNNLYIWNNFKVTAVTTDGGPEIFHGAPDWVYEEEVLENRNAFWFSPDGEMIAFLTFDDKEVPLYTVPYYMNRQTIPPAYPFELKLKYPKVGYPNPVVTARLFAVNNPGKLTLIPIDHPYGSDENYIVGEVAWVTNTHSKLIIRTFNRIQTSSKHLIYDVATNTLKVSRERDAKDGWIDNTKSIIYAGKVNGTDSYIDESDEDGWAHIWLFPTDPGKGTQLTSGKWEVRRITRVDKTNGRVFYTSSENHPTESHAYVLSLLTGSKQELTDKKAVPVTSKSGFWDLSVSPSANFAILSYRGPDIPHEEIYSVNSSISHIRTLEKNTALTKVLAEYALPVVKFMDLPHPSGFNLSAKLVYPVGFSESKQYPVLLTPYGGPGSQEVQKTFNTAGFKSYISSDPDLEYATFTVDNRGTSQRGRAFRQQYYKRMGDVDVADQLWAARWLADTYPWVDRTRIGIWGWSNGGYISAKAVEADDPILAFAIATAPTSDQRLYDSIYSERFLGSVTDSRDAYDRAAVRNATGFKNLRGSILFQHGTGDENVHFQHSLALVDMLMEEGVHPNRVQVQYFPDSEHNIRYGRDSDFLYKQLTAKLYAEKVRNANEKHQWEEQHKEFGRSVFGGNERNVLQSMPTYNSKWRMVQGELVIMP